MTDIADTATLSSKTNKASGSTEGTLAPDVAANPAAKRPGFGIMFWAGAFWLTLIILAAAFGWAVPLADPDRVSPKDSLLPILSSGHVLGTDQLGRDILARIVDGARVSVIISTVSVTTGVLIGGMIGTAIGYLRGWPERIVVALTNVLLSFPSLILLLGVVAMVGPTLFAITAVLAFLSIPGYIRFSRARALALAEEGYVLAARAFGTTTLNVIRHELLPNVMTTLITFGLLALGGVIVAEGSLAFFGLSVPAPQATWGGMIAEGKTVLDRTLHVAVVPSVVMFLTVLSLNLVGDGLRRRLDVRDMRL